MRSNGQVRFIRLSSRLQMAVAGAGAALLLAWLTSLVIVAVDPQRAQSELAALSDREARVAKSESRVADYRHDVDIVAAELRQRQDFIESVVPMLPDDMVSEQTSGGGETATGDDGSAQQVSGEEDQALRAISAAVPEARALAAIEQRQLAFVERLTRFADRRADNARRAIRKLGLDPAAMLSRARSAQGGPLERLATGIDGTLDPRFERLGESLERMAAYERSLNGIPQVTPARMEMVSSGFGYRRDPFTRAPAMHSGLDFRGPVGTPILAAARGTVTFVGRKAGYGKVVEIGHGNGLTTRYAHMSKWTASRGEAIEAGQKIGEIGSTGRSTGPHLHFEVRVNGRAVNPRPFLETAPDVLEEARSDHGRADGQARS